MLLIFWFEFKETAPTPATVVYCSFSPQLWRPNLAPPHVRRGDRWLETKISTLVLHNETTRLFSDASAAHAEKCQVGTR